eukprot:871207-Pleurochrysis_carterae.AAC.1
MPHVCAPLCYFGSDAPCNTRVRRFLSALHSRASARRAFANPCRRLQGLELRVRTSEGRYGNLQVRLRHGALAEGDAVFALGVVYKARVCASVCAGAGASP